MEVGMMIRVPDSSVAAPGSSRAVPDICEYQGGHIFGFGGFGM